MLKKDKNFIRSISSNTAEPYEQAVAQLNASEANLEKVQQDADRYVELGKSGCHSPANCTACIGGFASRQRNR